jgi:hypothetical protein
MERWASSDPRVAATAKAKEEPRRERKVTRS